MTLIQLSKVSLVVTTSKVSFAQVFHPKDNNKLFEGQSMWCNNTLPYTITSIGEDVKFELKGSFIVSFRIEACLLHPQ